MVGITVLPLELIEHILYTLDPLDVSYLAQSSRFFRELIYGDKQSQRFWRGLYLAQELDDPRSTVTCLGSPRTGASPASRTAATTTVAESPQISSVDGALTSPASESNIDWRGELQRIIRARTVVLNPRACRKGELKEVLQTLLDLATMLPPVPFAESECTSRNVVFVHDLLRDGVFLDIGRKDDGRTEDGYGCCQPAEEEIRERGHGVWTWTLPNLTSDESQMLARLHTCVGLTERDVSVPHKRFLSRAFVYDLRNYSTANVFGPFMLDGSMRVDWTYIQALAHVYGLVWMEMENEDIGECSDHFDMAGAANGNKVARPFGLSFCQSVIPPGMNLDVEVDWAGVEGLWLSGYCFLDHREFLVYNYSSSPPLDTSVFEGDDVPETHSSVSVYFRVTSVESDPDHPTRPKINFAGEIEGNATVLGFVKLTPDEQVWWHFDAGTGDSNHVWSCEGVGLGGVRSLAGIVGVWSTVFHDAEDPVGPFWMRRQRFIED